MAIRLQTKYRSTNGHKFRVSLYDKDFVGTPADFNIQGNGVIFKTNGDEKDLYKKPLSLASCSVTLLDDSTEVDTFLDDIIDAEESRFYLIVEREIATDTYVNEFKGMILVESITINDEFKPSVTLEAVCGLSVLKGIEYEFGSSPATFFKTLREILYLAIIKNPVIEEFYSDTDVVMVLNSRLEVDHAAYAANGDNIFETIYHSDFFFDINENIRTNWDCYTVLEVMLKKYGMRLVYDDGVYNIVGIETYYQIPAISNIPTVKKNGTLGTTLNIDYAPKNVEANNYAGGNHGALKGYRQVKVLASREGSNVYLMKDYIKTLADYSSAYFTAPPMIANTEFEINIKIIATILAQFSAPEYFRQNKIQYYLSLYVKFTDQETSDVFYGSIFGPRVNEPGDSHIFAYGETELETKIYFGSYIGGTFTSDLNLVFPAYAKDRKVEIKYDLKFAKDYVDFDPGVNLREYDYRLTWNMGASPVGETQAPIPINAYVDNSKNLSVYTHDIYSSQMYGGNGTIALTIHDGALGALTGWRFNNFDAWKGLEAALATFMMKNLHLARRTLTLPVQIKTYSGPSSLFNPKAFSIVSYLGKTYIVASFEQHYLDDVVVIKGIEKRTPSTATITTNSIVVNRPSGGATTTNLRGGIKESATKAERTKKDYTVTGSTLVLGNEFFVPPNATFASVVMSMDILIDGVSWEISSSPVDPDDVDGAYIGYVNFVPGTKTITFGMNLTSTNRVTVICTPVFIIDESITSI